MQGFDPAAIPSEALGARLREAREYVGFALGETARFLDLSPTRLAAIEEGRETPAPETFDRLAALYRRQAEWFDESHVAPALPPEIARLADETGLSDADRGELVRFADFLAGAPRANG